MKAIKMVALLIIGTISLLVTSCVTTPDIRNLSSEDRSRAGNIIILTESLPNDTYRLIGYIEGISCKGTYYSNKVVNEQEAVDSLKIKAAQLGANAVANVVCQYKPWGFNNCVQSILCVGDAVLISNPTILNRIGKKDDTKLSKTESVGTGWVIKPGFIVTNHHVIKDATNIVGHLNDGRSLKLSVAMDDPINDLALLLPPINTQLPQFIPLAKKGATVGETVFTIGFPHTQILGSNAKVTSGIISACSGLRDDPRLYQTTVQLQAGNSGGPLMNMSGEAIGIATSKLDAVSVFRFTGDLPEGVNYAVKSQYISALIASANTVEPGSKSEEISGFFKNLQDVVSAVEDSVLLIVAK